MEKFLNFQYDLLQNKIIYDSPPSRRQLSTVKVSINVWYEENVFENWDVAQTNNIQNWNMVQRNVQDKVPSLTIPKTLKEALALMAELIGNELKVLFQKLLIFIIEFPRDWHFLKKGIYWTTQGTIDKKRTLEAFADCEDLELATRFEIAQMFFLKKHINELALKLPPNFIPKLDDFNYASLREMPGVSTAREHFGILT